MRHIWSKLVLAVLCLALLAGSVSAGEVTLSLRFRPIESGVFAADSMYGVSANYQNGSTIYCSELVTRFYQTLYGVDVMVGTGPYVVNSDTYWFETTEAPEAGDVAYAAPAKRGKGYAHYALVKYANAETGIVTLMEQNWSWNGGAAYERTIPYSDDCYVFYTLRCKSGKPQMALAEADTVSAWAEDYVARADALGVTEGLVAGYRRAVTRGVLARLCINAAEYAGLKVAQSNPYGAAVALGIMESHEDGEFAPWETVTRAEAAVVLTRLLGCIGTVPEVRQSALQALTDAADIPEDARDGVAVMSAAGLMQTQDGRFRPNDAITTEQVISLLVRMLENPAPADLTRRTANTAAAKRAEPVPLSAGQAVTSASAVGQWISSAKPA